MNNEFDHISLFLAESRNVNLQGGPVSLMLTNVLQILNSCDNTEVDVLPQVRTGHPQTDDVSEPTGSL